jgi:aerobic carbon-monoxide dehydrogenase medium subunit
MIPQNFDYSAPANLKEALTLLAGGKAKILAGGMSLIPLMKLRLAAPEHVVDISRIPGLSYVREEQGTIRVGALTTHYEVETNALLRGKCPLLPETASHIGDVQVRNMGTLGGSIAHADPAADYPAALYALEAKVRLVSAKGDRTLSMDEFLVDTMTTAIEWGEIVLEVILPVEAGGTGVSYQKMPQPASGFALVGVAARIASSGGKISMARVGVTGVAPKAYRAEKVEELLAGKSGTAEEIRQAAAVIADEVEPNSDLHASADYRAQMAKVYAARAITSALQRTA